MQRARRDSVRDGEQMNKTNFNGFHNSFDAYCEWCEKQTELKLPTVNWGKWWDSLEAGE